MYSTVVPYGGTLGRCIRGQVNPAPAIPEILADARALFCVFERI